MKNLILLLISFVLFNDYSFSQTINRGMGVLYLENSLPENDSQIGDTIILYKGASNVTCVAGKFVFNPNNRFDNKIIENEEVVTKSHFEFDYETFGLPIVSIKNNWVEVIIGFDSRENQINGFAEIQNGHASIHLWADFLLTKDLIFDYWNDVPIAFYDSPNGDQVYFGLEPSNQMDYDYIMRAVERQGNWMKVKVTTPSDNCIQREYKIVKEFWIQYLAPDYRPQVFYFPRGC